MPAHNPPAIDVRVPFEVLRRSLLPALKVPATAEFYIRDAEGAVLVVGPDIQLRARWNQPSEREILPKDED